MSENRQHVKLDGAKGQWYRVSSRVGCFFLLTLRLEHAGEKQRGWAAGRRLR